MGTVQDMLPDPDWKEVSSLTRETVGLATIAIEECLKG